MPRVDENTSGLIGRLDWRICWTPLWSPSYTTSTESPGRGAGFGAANCKLFNLASLSSRAFHLDWNKVGMATSSIFFSIHLVKKYNQWPHIKVDFFSVPPSNTLILDHWQVFWHSRALNLALHHALHTSKIADMRTDTVRCGKLCAEIPGPLKINWHKPWETRDCPGLLRHWNSAKLHHLTLEWYLPWVLLTERRISRKNR